MDHADSTGFEEITKEPDSMSDFRREQLQTRVLYRNFSVLYLHLDCPSVLPNLLHNEIIDPEKAEKLRSFSQKCAQNVLLIRAFFDTSMASQLVLKFCEALSTTSGQDALAKMLLAGWWITNFVLESGETVLKYQIQ